MHDILAKISIPLILTGFACIAGWVTFKTFLYWVLLPSDWVIAVFGILTLATGFLSLFVLYAPANEVVG